MTKLLEHQQMYVRSMGKLLLVTALFTDDDAANRWMERNPDHGVIAVYGDVVFLAHLHDKGLEVNVKNLEKLRNQCRP